jgi:hypothetical protein
MNGFNNMQNIMNMVKQFNQFKSSFTGDPRQQVQQLLNNGKMSQSQLNQLMQMANQFQNLLPK